MGYIGRLLYSRWQVDGASRSCAGKKIAEGYRACANALKNRNRVIGFLQKPSTNNPDFLCSMWTPSWNLLEKFNFTDLF